MLNGAIFLPTSGTNAIADRFVFTGLCSVFGFALFFLGHAIEPTSCLCWFLIAFLLSLYHFGTNDSGSEWSFLSLSLSLSLGAWILVFIVAFKLVLVKGALDCYSVERSSWGCYPSQGCYHQRACLIYTRG